MSKIFQALIWALAILLMAVAGHFGWIDRDTSRTMLIVLPALAIVAIGNRRSCLPRSAAR